VDPVVQVLKLRQAVLEAITWEDWAKLRASVKTLAQLPMTATALAESGIGLLLNDVALDRHLGPVSAYRAAAVDKWKAIAVDQPVRKRARSPTSAALNRSWSSVSFAADTETMRVHLAALDDQPAAKAPTYRNVAARLVLHGLSKPSHLVGLQPDEAASIFTKIDEVALARRVVLKVAHRHSLAVANELADAQQRSSGSGRLNDERPPCSVGTIIAQLRVEVFQAKYDKWVGGLQEAGIPDGGVHALPRHLIDAVRRAAIEYEKVRELLDDGVEVLKLSSQKRSAGSVAAGLKCWSMFAREVLRYDAARDIPPRCSQDVQRWLPIFRNARTAANYLGYLRWACKANRLDLAWDDLQLGVILRGARVRTLDTIGTAMPAKWRLTTALVAQVVGLMDVLPGIAEGMQECTIASWSGLLRVQSEAIGLEKGDPGEITGIAPSRHSSVYIDADESLVIGLRRRKHRPRGSVLIRKCICAKRGASVCPPHRFRALLEEKATGERLWHFSADELRKQVRRCLGLLRVEGASAYTLKAFRAGHASELAASGAGWANVLAAGEWKSLAALSYVDPDEVDAAAAAWEAVAASSDEEATDAQGS